MAATRQTVPREERPLRRFAQIGWVVVICSVILILLVIQQSLWSDELDSLSMNRGALLQAIVYAAQTILLLLVLWTALGQARISNEQARISGEQLQALQMNIQSTTIQSVVSAHRDIVDVAMAKPAVLLKLLGSENETEVLTQLFADILINHAYTTFMLRELSALPKGIWETLQPGVLNVFNMPYVRTRWESGNIQRHYRQDFADFVNASIRAQSKEAHNAHE